jgi:hypothetical protein
MATSLTLQNDASSPQGYVKVNGTTSATFTTSGITGNLTGNVTGSLTAGGSLTLATAQTAPFTAPNTYADFTGIPSWAKRITVMFNGLSTSGTSNLLVQLGSGSITTSGYLSAVTYGTTNSASTSGMIFFNAGVAVDARYGQMIISNIFGSSWVSSGSINNTNQVWSFAGYVVLGGTLDRIRITSANGTDTFDAGTINIMFEG